MLTLRKHLDRARKAPAVYRRVFETIFASRHRLKEEVDRYRHAFETNRNDRNRWKVRCEAQSVALQWVLENAPLLAEPALLPMSGKCPQLVCVGAQKCSTSFLFSTVREHSGVSVGPKDTGRVTNKYPVIFEAGLVDREDGIERIQTFNPDARILICIRDPIDRALSEYKMRVRQGRETRSFREAIEANEQSGPFAYIRRSQYTADIKRFRAAFQHVLLLRSDDDTRTNIFKLFSFMGLRDAEALSLCANPPLKYALRSSGDAQAERADLTPEQQGLHSIQLSEQVREQIRASYFS